VIRFPGLCGLHLVQLEAHCRSTVAAVAVLRLLRLLLCAATNTLKHEIGASAGRGQQAFESVVSTDFFVS